MRRIGRLMSSESALEPIRRGRNVRVNEQTR
jgi:hypothetical protein